MVSAVEDISGEIEEDEEFNLVDESGAFVVMEERELHSSELRAAAEEGYCIGRRLAWQDSNVKLCFRRLLLSRRGEHRVRRREARKGDNRKRRRSVETGLTVYESEGTIFGCTLGNLMHFARGLKHSLHVAKRRLDMCMELVSAAALRMRGSDSAHLVRGMGDYRVIASLGTMFPECGEAPCIKDRTNSLHPRQCYGAVLSVFIVFTIVATAMVDEEALEPSLESVCTELESQLRNWRGVGCWTREQEEALGAEQRASERALLAVKLARKRANEARMAPAESLKLQLNFLRRAVWPVDEVVGPETQSDLKRRLESGELVDVERAPRAGAPVCARRQGGQAGFDWFNAPGVLPLAELPFAPRPLVAGDDRSSVTGSSYASSSVGSWASGGSGGSWGSLGSAGGAAENGRAWVFPQEMSERMRQLSASLGMW